VGDGIFQHGGAGSREPFLPADALKGVRSWAKEIKFARRK
jgi:hypothetical protein